MYTLSLSLNTNLLVHLLLPRSPNFKLEIRRFHHFYMTLAGKPNLHHREVKTDHNTTETNTL